MEYTTQNQIHPDKTAEQISEDCRFQIETCKTKAWIHFAPYDGVCFVCRKNIFQNYGPRKGHDGHNYITGCPHCNASFCD